MVCAIVKVTYFIIAAGEFKTDKTNPGKQDTILTMLLELNATRLTVKDNIPVMENSVGEKLALVEIVDNSISLKFTVESLFSGILTEWQEFENFFTSILFHAPDLSDFECSRS